MTDIFDLLQIFIRFLKNERIRVLSAERFGYEEAVNRYYYRLFFYCYNYLGIHGYLSFPSTRFALHQVRNYCTGVFIGKSCQNQMTAFLFDIYREMGLQAQYGEFTMDKDGKNIRDMCELLPQKVWQLLLRDWKHRVSYHVGIVILKGYKPMDGLSERWGLAQVINHLAAFHKIITRGYYADFMYYIISLSEADHQGEWIRYSLASQIDLVKVCQLLLDVTERGNYAGFHQKNVSN